MGSVYSIRHVVSKKQYIGSTINSKKRFSYHLSQLRRGCHGNVHLQRAFDKYGEDQFEFSVIEECDNTDLLRREAYWIEHYDATSRANGYNMTSNTTMPRLGIRHTNESKEKMSMTRRASQYRGERHGNSKLTEDMVRSIVDCFNNGDSQSEIADKAGVSNSTVSLILRGKSWSHLKLAENVNLPLNNTSGCIGVYQVKKSGKWKAEIIVEGKYHGLGCFANKHDAVAARKNAEVCFGLRS